VTAFGGRPFFTPYSPECVEGGSRKLVLRGGLGDLGVLIFLVALIGDIGVGRRRMRSGLEEPRPGGLASGHAPAL
jgi:hypothetical protein